MISKIVLKIIIKKEIFTKSKQIELKILLKTKFNNKFDKYLIII